MRFGVVTLFPELFEPFLRVGVLGKAVPRCFSVDFSNPREFGHGKHKSVDDAPYGGGSGMVMMPDPIVAAIEAQEQAWGVARAHRILLTPQGKPFEQHDAKRLATLGSVMFVCGRYEGIDDRVRAFVDEELSVGDFVLTGGEVAAMAMIEATARLLPGVLGNESSPKDESHAAGLLEYPQFTRPQEFRGMQVPGVLLSGDHGSIQAWREQESLRRTRERRPDMLRSQTKRVRRTPVYSALVHYPVLDREGNTVTTAVTNLDVHDLARSARTYELSGYFVVTPISAQRVIVERIIEHWRGGPGTQRIPERGDALGLCLPVATVEEAHAHIEQHHGVAPRWVATSARPLSGRPLVSFDEEFARIDRDETPVLLLFGTGHGLIESVLQRAEDLLVPIQPDSSYNHLSVRAAAAIVLDRLFGAC